MLLFITLAFLFSYYYCWERVITVMRNWCFQCSCKLRFAM